jgi:hypothetical protein
MFFKKRISVTAYCEAALQALLGAENTQDWLSLKSSSKDSALRGASDSVFLDELLGAHLQLLALAITKQFHDINLAAEAYLASSAFLKSQERSHVEPVKDAYNRAFGSSASDGVLAMTRLFNDRLANGKLSEQSTGSIYDLLYKSLSSHFADFKSLKLVQS